MKIKNPTLRFLAGGVILAVILTVATFVFYGIGDLAKIIMWGAPVPTGFWATVAIGIPSSVVILFLVLIVWAVIMLTLAAMRGLGDKYFNL